MDAGSAVMTTGHHSDLLSPWAGLGVFLCYVVAALALGLVTLRRKDA
jgi:hypothetical protein